VRKPIDSHSPPKWSDEPAVLRFITLWFDEHERSEVMAYAAADDDGPVRITRSLDLHDLARMLRSGEPISPQHRAHFANQLADLLQPKRKRGRPRRSIEQRRAGSIMPDAEGLFMAVVDFLKRHYPKEKVGVIKDRAIAWTVAKINTYEVDGSEPLTKRRLRNYMLRPKADRRRL
jgi:hypothetical protein